MSTSGNCMHLKKLDNSKAGLEDIKNNFSKHIEEKTGGIVNELKVGKFEDKANWVYKVNRDVIEIMYRLSPNFSECHHTGYYIDLAIDYFADSLEKRQTKDDSSYYWRASSTSKDELVIYTFIYTNEYKNRPDMSRIIAYVYDADHIDDVNAHIESCQSN